MRAAHIEGDLVDVVEPATQAARAAEVVQRRPAPRISALAVARVTHIVSGPTKPFPT